MILRAHMNLQRKHLEDVQICEGSCSPGKDCTAVLQLLLLCFLRSFPSQAWSAHSLVQTLADTGCAPSIMLQGT